MGTGSRWTALAITGAAALVFAGSFGAIAASPSAPTASPPASSPALGSPLPSSPGSACHLVSSIEIAAIFGVPDVRADHVDLGEGAISCYWDVLPGRRASILLATGATDPDPVPGQLEYDEVLVEGAGDTATWASREHVLDAALGDKVLVVRVPRSMLPRDPADMDHAAIIARLVFARLSGPDSDQP